MLKKRFYVAFMAAIVLIPVTNAQETPKPGPEYDVLKKYVGDWTTVMKARGMEFKGTVTYKMELGGLWLLSNTETDMGGNKFQGRGMDSFDAGKKKYMGVWIDSMLTTPLVLQGTFDKEKKTLTMTGEGTGPDSKPAKFKAVTVWKDDDKFDFSMFIDDVKEPGFVIAYTRKE